jgi:hypothetical protein
MPNLPPADNEQPPTPAPAGWLEALAESEAQLAAGQTVPADTVHQGLRDSIARPEAKRANDRRHETASRD